MNNKINKWIKDNCQQEPTKQKLEFYKIDSDKAFMTVYLKDDFQGYLTDDIDEILGEDTEWEAMGSDLYINNDNILVVITDTPITNKVLF